MIVRRGAADSQFCFIFLLLFYSLGTCIHTHTHTTKGGEAESLSPPPYLTRLWLFILSPAFYDGDRAAFVLSQALFDG